MAVYTEITDEDLNSFISKYDIGIVVSCKGIAEGVENSNFCLQTDQGSFILTLYERRVNIGDLPFFLGLMEHLAHAGLACPTPVRGKDGYILHTLCRRPAAVVTFLSGIWPQFVTPSHCTAVGQALATLHLAGQGYQGARRNSLSAFDLRLLFEGESQRIDSILVGLSNEVLRELDYLESFWPTTLPSGIIHADLFPDNTFFKDEKITGVIDFYFACNDFFAYDIAVCLNAWCFETNGTFNTIKAQSLLSSYHQVRSLEEQELVALPLLARGAAMRFLLTRVHDWLNKPVGAFVKPKNPLEYVHKVRFHRGFSG